MARILTNPTDVTDIYRDVTDMNEATGSRMSHIWTEPATDSRMSRLWSEPDSVCKNKLCNVKVVSR